MSPVDLVVSGREAMARNAWAEAFDVWSRADEHQDLEPGELEDFALAAWWTGQPDRCIAIRERAYGQRMRAGDTAGAGRLSLELAEDHFHKGSNEIGMGWLNRSIELLGTDGETPESAWLSRTLTVVAFEGEQDIEKALDLANKTYDLAVRHGDRNLQALSLHDRGRVTVASGDVEGGMKMMDEAMVAAIGGELDAVTTGRVYCNMIDICEQLADYRRAGDWSDAAKRWCERAGNDSGFPGVCRVHRAEIMKLRGDWVSAEEEASKATAELGTFLAFSGEAMYEIGDIRLGMGDFEAAEDAFRRAHAMGRDPQPGLAKLELARGNSSAAATMIKRALESSTAPLARARLLPTAVEAALGGEDIESAHASVEELISIAAGFGSSSLEAHASHAKGQVALANGDIAAANEAFQTATDLRLKDDLPYLAAKSRTLLAQSYQQLGDQVMAELEYNAARNAFVALGAMKDVALTADALASLRPATQVTDRRVAALMFTDIVDSTSLIGVIGDEPWEALLRWHHRTLRALFAKHDGHEVENTGDGFFVAFEEGEGAISCAIDIQNTLAAHRSEQGFAPKVRIGVNRGQVSEVSSTLAGEEVHRTARLCSTAEPGEILVTADLVDQVPPGVGTERRSVELKGFAESTDVVSIIPV